MKANEFTQLIKSGEAKVLTKNAAKSLNGKKIAWMYYGYKSNENTVSEMVVGDIISEWDYNKNQPFEGFESRTAQWDTWMTDKQKDESKNTLMLLDADGNDSFIKCFNNSRFYEEDTFTCSDADREVYYIEL